MASHSLSSPIYITQLDIQIMRGSSQKHKIVRRPSANSRESSASSQTDKQDRLLELRAKIEKERDAMRKTGKRFNKNNETENSTPAHQEEEQEVVVERPKMVTPFFKRESKVAESTAKPQPLPKATSTQKIEAVVPPAPSKTNLNLSELIPQHLDSSMLSSSRVFEREVSEQKTRNVEVGRFLEGIGLGEYSEGLINMGYDQLEVLMEVKAEELNFLMMRARQQKKLMEALDALRKKTGAEKEERNQTLMGLPSLFKTRVGMKAPNKKVAPASQNSPALSSRPKSALTETSTIPTNNSQLFTNFSFFCGIGGNEWSMDSLVRRACSGCYKVVPSGEMTQKGSCYYCKVCEKMEDDVLGLTLSGSMVRDYSARQL